MIEALKTLRLVHRLIIVVSVTFLAFAITPTDKDKYMATMKQLRKLQKDDFFDKYKKYIEDVGIQESEEIKAVLDNVAKSLNVKIEERPRPHLTYVPLPPKTASLAEFLTFFNKDKTVFIAKPQESELEALLIEKLQSDSIKAGENIIGLRFKLLGKPEFVVERKFLIISRIKPITMVLSGKIAHKDGLERPFSLNIQATVRKDETANDWLESHDAKWFVKELEKSEEQFPLIRHKSLGEAMEYLESKLDSEVDDIQLFNLKVSERRVVWVAPVVTFALLLYFLSHIKHLLFLYKNKPDRQLNQFPWISLYPDLLSKVLTFSTVFLLPVAANVCLVFRTLDDFGSLQTFIGIVFTILDFFLGIQVYQKLELLK